MPANAIVYTHSGRGTAVCELLAEQGYRSGVTSFCWGFGQIVRRDKSEKKYDHVVIIPVFNFLSVPENVTTLMAKKRKELLLKARLPGRPREKWHH